MSAKEKALELIQKYNLVVLDTALGGSNQRVKKCALIAVDEVLKDKEIIDGMRVINDPYWIKVKQEIEKL